MLASKSEKIKYLSRFMRNKLTFPRLVLFFKIGYNKLT